MQADKFDFIRLYFFSCTLSPYLPPDCINDLIINAVSWWRINLIYILSATKPCSSATKISYLPPNSCFNNTVLRAKTTRSAFLDITSCLISYPISLLQLSKPSAENPWVLSREPIGLCSRTHGPAAAVLPISTCKNG